MKPAESPGTSPACLYRLAPLLSDTASTGRLWEASDALGASFGPPIAVRSGPAAVVAVAGAVTVKVTAWQSVPQIVSVVSPVSSSLVSSQSSRLGRRLRLGQRVEISAGAGGEGGRGQREGEEGALKDWGRHEKALILMDRLRSTGALRVRRKVMRYPRETFF